MEIKPTEPNTGKAVLTWAGTEISPPTDVELRAENEFEFSREERRVDSVGVRRRSPPCFRQIMCRLRTRPWESVGVGKHPAP
jgi:hypothetical protein